MKAMAHSIRGRGVDLREGSGGGHGSQEQAEDQQQQRGTGGQAGGRRRQEGGLAGSMGAAKAEGQVAKEAGGRRGAEASGDLDGFT